MATNAEAVKRQEAEKTEYDWGTLWPHYHKERMNWATGFRTRRRGHPVSFRFHRT